MRKGKGKFLLSRERQLRIGQNSLNSINKQEHDAANETSLPFDTAVQQEVWNDDSDVDNSAITYVGDDSDNSPSSCETSTLVS